MTSPSSPSSPSNHQTTAAKLRTRGITFERKALEGSSRPDFACEWQRFAGLCGCQTTAQDALTTLGPIISGFHTDEVEFDRALFTSIPTILGTQVQQVNANLFVFCKNTSIGLARQLDRQTQLGFGTEHGLTTDSTQDHAIVLVDAARNIVDETSLVELKTRCGNDWHTFIANFDSDSLDPLFWDSLTQVQRDGLHAVRDGRTTLVTAIVVHLLTTLTSIPALSE
jgi:hypothetical protein